jgi:orotidine-5'-phosphate decarboxylase
MIEKAKEAASEIKSQPKILMVTILTSLNDNDLKIMGNDSGVMQQVEHFAKIAKEMGVGVVCSGT